MSKISIVNLIVFIKQIIYQNTQFKHQSSEENLLQLQNVTEKACVANLKFDHVFNSATIRISFIRNLKVECCDTNRQYSKTYRLQELQ